MGQASSSRTSSFRRSASRFLKFRHKDRKNKHQPSLAPGPIQRLPPELLLMLLDLLEADPESIGLASIVRVCRAWNQAAIPLLYNRISINEKSLRLISRTLRSSPDLGQLVSFLTVTLEEESSLLEPAKRTRIETPLGNLLAQTISYCKDLYSVTIHDSRLLKFQGTHPPLPPIGFRQSFFQPTLFGHHNLFSLWIEAQDISVDSIFLRNGDSSDFPFPNLRSLQLMNIWMDAHHQFPVMAGLWILTIHNPRIRPSPPTTPPTFCVDRGSFPSVHALTLGSNSTELGSLVDSTFIEGIEDLIFDIPSPLPLKEMTSIQRLTLMYHYTRKHGLALPELPQRFNR
ncbi:hypothetical protein NLI96_g6819 [Meripilus lineatus]|uniref:F-box domain-containing protein n=1 Tax=Meripilus lineatus TaxID=2056292 RepID=A0AAD5V080_9APHY|nr:hypothetical protein NLI96_g6819 [Physisporinus lineatus]